VPFDWRLGIPSNGRALAARLSEALAAPDARVALVAHSMGGLVASDAVARLPPEQQARIAGMVALGTPWLGSYQAVRGLILDAFAEDGFGRFARTVLQSLHALIHLVPPDNPLLLDPALYAPGPLAGDARLQAALAQVTSLVRRPPPRTFALVSDGYPTLAGLHRDSAGLGWAYRPGDGVVALASATAFGVAFDRVTAFHPVMPLHPSVIAKTIAALAQMLAA